MGPARHPLKTLTVFLSGFLVVSSVLVGDSCNRPNDCDTTINGLTCQFPEQQCVCKYLPHAYFDYLTQTCLIKHGQPCDPDIADGQCTPNADCVLDPNNHPKCVCQTGYEATDSGKCVKNHLEACNIDEDCNPDKFLICDSGSCGCKPGSIYESLLDTCVTIVGEECELESYKEKCQFYASCNTTITGGTLPGKCACDPGLYRNGVDLCVNGFNDTCYPGPPDSCEADQFLQCGPDRRCQCFNPLTQYYDFVDRRCEIRAGQTCAQSVIGPQCTDFASCQPINDGSGANNYYCLCQSGTYVSGDKCVINYGNSCTIGSLNRPRCDEDRFMTCDSSSFTCMCRDMLNTWYDPSVNQCHLLSGSTCTPPAIDPAAQSCTPNSECIPNGLGTGICTCLPGVFENAERKCYLPHLYACNPSSDLCDPSAFLTCNATTLKCECSDSANTFYEQYRGCVTKGGSACNTTIFAQPCASRSVCTYSGGVSYCKCDVGLTVGVGGKCTRQYGETCDVNGFGPEVCDPDGYQQCSTGGRCECSDPLHMTYNSVDRKCYFVAKRPCILDGPPCDKDLACINNVCECDPGQGLVEGPTGQCTRYYGAPCSVGSINICNPALYLECVNGFCYCQPSHQPISIGNSTKCVGNLNGYCVDSSECNAAGGLVCALNTCQCYSPSEQNYNYTSKACDGQPGTRCHLTDFLGADPVKLTCAPGLVCRAGADLFYGFCDCDYYNPWSPYTCGAELHLMSLRNLFLPAFFALLHIFRSLFQ